MASYRDNAKRKELYLLEIQKTVEHQLAVLKAEHVLLERQILHHEQHQEESSRKRQNSVDYDESSDSGNDLPELRLQLSSRQNILDYNEIEMDED